MKYIFLACLYAISISTLFSQESVTHAETIQDSTKTSYPNYKEDQFYAGVTYNILINKPNQHSQSGFSIGLLFGFIKDMPINKRRNLAIGLGAGLASNSFNNNMLIEKEPNGSYAYSILSTSGISYSQSKLTTYKLEVPLEFRWRTSTSNEYKFWRIYTGFKLGYVFVNTYKFDGDLGRFRYSNIADMNAFQYGLTLSAGYNTWNLHLYYGLNTLFNNDAFINNHPLELSTLKLGLIFYIL